MKFAVGDRVVATREDSGWRGAEGVVKKIETYNLWKGGVLIVDVDSGTKNAIFRGPVGFYADDCDPLNRGEELVNEDWS